VPSTGFAHLGGSVTGVCKKPPDGDLCGSIAVINALRIHGVVLWADVENLVIKSDADWGGGSETGQVASFMLG
jgi:hypothetical protein